MFPMALTKKKAKRVGRREYGFGISFDSWNAGDTMLPAVTAAMKASVCLANMALGCSLVISAATLHSCPAIQNPGERAGLNSTTLTIVGIPICSTHRSRMVSCR
jgi:hypothetical protein